jgi:anti-sigma factor RsiW
MITCRELAELLFDIASGQLAPEYREHVEEHLNLCPSCVAYLESYRLTIQMTRQLPRSPLPLHFARQLRALVEEGRRTQTAEGEMGTPAAEAKP